jgi:hypothetical protein
VGPAAAGLIGLIRGATAAGLAATLVALRPTIARLPLAALAGARLLQLVELGDEIGSKTHRAHRRANVACQPHPLHVALPPSPQAEIQVALFFLAIRQ